MGRAIFLLNSIFQNFDEALKYYIQIPPQNALTFFWSNHIPLILIYPVSIIASPIPWIMGKTLTFSKIFFPIFCAVLFLLTAIIYDKITEHQKPPTLADGTSPVVKNLSLFSHIPVSGCGIFFLFYPTFGYIMLFLAVIYSVTLSVQAQCRFHRITPARAIAQYINAIIFMVAILLVPLFLINILTTFRIFRGMGIF